MPSNHKPSAARGLSSYYALVRNEDVSGVSGIGIVAYAEKRVNGEVSVYFKAREGSDGDRTDPSISTHPHMQNAMRVHGHGGKTQFVESITIDGREFAAGQIEGIREEFFHAIKRGQIHDAHTTVAAVNA